MLSFDATRPGSGKRRLRRIDARLADALTGTAHFTQALSLAILYSGHVGDDM